MQKIFLLLVAAGMIVTSANAQTQRVNRTNARTTKTATQTTNTVEAQPQNSKQLPTGMDPAVKSIAEQGSGVTGIDGTYNSKETSGQNNSSSLDESNQQINNPPVASPNAGTAQPVRTTPAKRVK